MNGKLVIKAFWSWCKQNSTRILAGGAIVSEIFGFYFMHKEAPIVKEKLDALPDDASWIDKVKTAGPVYIPAAGMLILSAGCIIGGCAIGEARAAMMAGLYSASETALRKYEEKMIETVGEEKAQQMHNEVAKELETNLKPTENSEVIYTAHGGDLFYDPLSARMFTSSESYIRSAVEKINDSIYGIDMWAGVNEWYDLLGLAHPKLAGPFGWTIDYKLSVSFAPARTEDGRYYGVIVYYNKPRLYNGELPPGFND